MIVKESVMMHDVKVCMDHDEVSVDIDVPFSVDGVVETHSVTIDDIIRQKLPQAIDRVHIAAPYHMLETGHNLLDTDVPKFDAIYWADNDSAHENGWILLPEDFLRLSVFEMSDWACPVYELITPADPRYQLQYSRYKGIRGTADQPVCVLGVRPEGRVLEFYSCRSKKVTVTRGVYIPKAEKDNDGGYDVSPLCYDAMVSMAAGMTLLTIGERERANAMFEEAKSFLQ